MRGDVLVVDADLMALARIRDAAGRAGREVKTATSASVRAALAAAPEMVVLDIDRGGTELVQKTAEALGEGAPRVLAFFSHINEDLGRAAREAGFETYARGKFWRSLDEVFG